MDIKDIMRLQEEHERLRRQGFDPLKIVQEQDRIKQLALGGRTFEEERLLSRTLGRDFDSMSLGREKYSLLQRPSAIEKQMELINNNVSGRLNATEKFAERINAAEKLTQRLNDTEKLTQRLRNDLLGLNTIKDRLFEATKPFNSALYDAAEKANRSALNALGQINKNESALSQASNIARGWNTELDRFREMNLAKNADLGELVNSRISRITQTSLLAESALTKFDARRLGSTLGITENVRSAVQNRFTDFSTSYQELFKSYERPETSFLTLPPRLVEMPTVEFFTGVELIKTTVNDEPDEFADEREIERESIREETADALAAYLSGFNPDLLKLRDGAKQASESKNPDKIRHCITSLRELVREVMHYLSPDDDIRSWSSSKDDFDRGKPTRRARLRYITRDISHGAFNDFVEKDINATLEAINMFQKGTHAVESGLTELQVFALIAKVETMLLFIFQIANQNK